MSERNRNPIDPDTGHYLAGYAVEATRGICQWSYGGPGVADEESIWPF